MLQFMNLRSLVKNKLFISIFLFLSILSFVHADIPITSCQSINSPGTYVLLNDVTSTSGVCFPIDADSVTLDCNGHKIDGSNNLDSSHAAIQIYQRTDVTLLDCVIERFGSPVWLDGTDRVSILNNVFRNNYQTIGVRYGEPNTRTVIIGNIFNNTYKVRPDTPTRNYTEGWGVFVFGNDSLIEDNYIFNTSWTLYSWPCTGNVGRGITVEGTNNVIRNNRLEANNCGIGVFGTNTTVEGNYIDGTGASRSGHGIGSSGDDSLFIQNTLINGRLVIGISGDSLSSVPVNNDRIINNLLFDDFSLYGENSLIAGNFFERDVTITSPVAYGGNNYLYNNTFNSSFDYPEIGGSNNRIENNWARSILLVQGSSDAFTSNNTIVNNTFLRGLASSYSNQLLIMNNSITYDSYFGRGISLGYGNDAVISGNIISGEGDAINAWYWNNALIFENTIINNNVGAYLLYSNYFNFYDNLLHSNSIGLKISYSDYFNLYDNLLHSNSIGLQISGSNYFRLIGNNVSSNGLGIKVLPVSQHGLVYNNFLSNTRNVESFPAFPLYNNTWSISVTPGPNIIGGPSIGGNYWSDYPGFDANDDGFGDTNIPFTANGNISGDYLPLTVFPNPYDCGDLNDDGQIDIVDVVSIVNIAFRGGTPPSPTWVADINGDGVISDILDVVGLINHAFRGAPEPTCYGGLTSTQASTTLTLTKATDGVLVSSNLDRNVAGLQFDLTYDASKIKIVGIQGTVKTSGMTITNTQISAGKNRIGVYSSDGASYIKYGAGSLLTIQVSGTDLSSLKVSPIVVDYETGKKFSTVNVNNKLISLKKLDASSLM